MLTIADKALNNFKNHIFDFSVTGITTLTMEKIEPWCIEVPRRAPGWGRALGPGSEHLLGLTGRFWLAYARVLPSLARPGAPAPSSVTWQEPADAIQGGASDN